jgi:hypothetical protein
MRDEGFGEEAVVLCRLDNYAEADLLVQVLRDEGFAATLCNDGPSAGIMGTACLGDGLESATWARWAVLVPESTRAEAEQVAREWQSAAPVSDAEPEP